MLTGYNAGLGSEVETSHRAYDEGDYQQDCDDQGNPSQASHSALAIVLALRRLGCGLTTAAVRLLRGDASGSSATTAATKASGARASWGMVVMPVRSLRHRLRQSPGNIADANCHKVLSPDLLLFAPANESRWRVRNEAGEIQRRVNEADMRVGLRKVTQLAVG